MVTSKSLTIRIGLVLLCFSMASSSFAQEVVRIDPYEEKYEPGVVMVKFDEEVDVPLGKKGRLGKVALTGIREILTKYGIEQGERLFPQAKRGEKLGKVRGFSGEEVEVKSLYNIFKLEFDPKHDPKTVAEELSKQDGVVYAEPDYWFYALEGLPSATSGGSQPSVFRTANTVPNDPLYSEQWYLGAFPGVNAAAAWDSTTGDTTQIIAIIDTGVDWDHPDLDDNIWRNWDEIPDNGIDDDGNGFVDDIRGWDFVNDDNNPNDDNSHGTHVAGIAAAEGNNGVGICGVAWNAKIMPVKMLQSSGSGSSSDLASAINYAANKGATVINMSLGSYAESQTVKTALENAYSNTVLVASAGNDHNNLDAHNPPLIYTAFFPACYPFVIGVEATTNSSDIAYFSNFDPSGPIIPNKYGHNYEMKTPGVSIYSTFPNGNYHYLNGTSMSSPLISGAVLLMREHNPFQSEEQLFARLIQGAQNGILDISKSFDYELEPDLYYLDYTLVDTLSGCDGDGRADAGETIELYLTVRNAGGFADSVWSKIRFSQFEDTTIADIVDSTSYIGDISAYATLTGILEPFRIQINPNAANNRDIVFEYEVGCNNSMLILKENLILTVQKGIEFSGYKSGLTILNNDSYYIVTDNLVIDSLVIKPGTNLNIDAAKTIAINKYVSAIGKKDSLITFTKNSDNEWGNIWISDQVRSPIFSHCIFEYGGSGSARYLIKNDSPDPLVITSSIFQYNNPQNEIVYYSPGKCEITNCLFVNNRFNQRPTIYSSQTWSNNTIVNNTFSSAVFHMQARTSVISRFNNNNIFNNTQYNISIAVDDFGVFLLSPNYYGTTNEENIEASILDYFEQSNLPVLAGSNNALAIPVENAPAIVWKAEINGANPQEENLDPLGSETIKFDVYFSCAMNTTYTPFLTFGVREPFTQHIVTDNAYWSADSTVWTAYYEVGIETGDGINTIRVANAKDTDHFEIPVEDSRFQFIIQAASAASNQFMATAAVGKVDLEWPTAPSDDALGYNMYRIMKLTDSTFTDTTRINMALVTDTTYTDFAVIPDSTYRYMYKVLGTDMTESDYSKSVSATPVNAASGDANGNMTVDVLDIVAIVNYILEENPQPFLFEAADVNSDGEVNVLDIVGVVNLILGAPKATLAANGEGEAKLFLTSEGLKLVSTASVAGLQFTLSGEEIEKGLLVPTEALDGMEIAKRKSGEKLICVIYNLRGKTLPLGERILFRLNGEEKLELESGIACNQQGEAIALSLEPGEEVLIPTDYELAQNYPNPFNPMTTIRYGLPKAGNVKLTIYNVLGQQVKTFDEGFKVAGYHKVNWDGQNQTGVHVATGVYFYELKVNQITKVGKMLLLR